jgi:predicted TPR repeat methyltransferase
VDEDYFDNNVEEYEKWFKANDKLLNSELDAIRPLIPKIGTGIEIGVGTGIFASELGIRYGIEPSEDMAAKARERGIHVDMGKAEKLPVDDGMYEFALMVTADCFMDDVQKVFCEVRRILVDGGIFIIAFLDKATSLGELYDKNKHLHKSYRNANFHSADDIAGFLEEAGFKIIEKKQTVFSLDNKYQEAKNGVGEGLFAVIKTVSSTSCKF